MATLLLIETSTSACSAALTSDGMVLCHRENLQGRQHASILSDFIKSCLDHAKEHGLKVDGVAVSLGPGSYTGLRIGLSEAKGLAYALDVPLIGVSTLELLAVSAMFSKGYEGQDLFIPMIDARRQEVYMAVYDSALTPLVEPRPMILEPGCLAAALDGRTALVPGDGAAKAAEAFGDAPGVVLMPDVAPLAVNMLALAERAWHKRDFLDLAYSVPVYLKEFEAVKAKRPF